MALIGITISFLFLLLWTAVDADTDRTSSELDAMLARRMWWNEAAAEPSLPSMPHPAQSLVSRIRSWARFRAL